MKDRIAHIMRAKNLKASDFATLLGIQPSGVSHILAGRNKPSLEFVKRIKETFPEYNLDWIIFGTGPITTSEPFKEPTKEIPQESPTVAQPLSEMIPFDYDPVPDDAEMTVPNVKSMVVLYEDGTFEIYSHR